MTSVLLELIRHKTWAMHKLIALCQSLDPALVDTTAPGTYGTVRRTLVHLVNSDRSYYRRLCGEQPWESMDEETTQLETLLERFDEIVAGWELLAQDDGLADRDLLYPKGEIVKGSAVFAQSLHHGDVHRAHVLSILGSNQLEVPELDLWEYVFELGLATPPSE